MTLEIGQTIVHEQFGTGVVTAVMGSDYAKALFEGDDTDKVFNQRFVQKTTFDKYLNIGRRSTRKPSPSSKKSQILAILQEQKTRMTVDDLVSELDQRHGFSAAQHNSVAPLFSAGNGGLFDDELVILVGIKTGTTRSGGAADEWVFADFATAEEKRSSRGNWLQEMKNKLADKKAQLLELPQEIANLEAGIARIETQAVAV